MALDLQTGTALQEQDGDSLLLQADGGGGTVDRTVTCVTATLTLTEGQATVTRGEDRTVTCTEATLTLTEGSASIFRGVDRTVTGTTEALSLNSPDASIFRGVDRYVTGVTETLLLTAYDAAVERQESRTVTCVTAAITLTANLATITDRPRTVTGITTALTLTSDDAIVDRGRYVTAATEQLTLAENPATVFRGEDRVVSCSTATLSLSEGAASIFRGVDRVVTGVTENIALTSTQSLVDRGRDVAGVTETLQLVANKATVPRDLTVTCTTTTMTLTEGAANIYRDRDVFGVTESLFLNTPDATVTYLPGRVVQCVAETFSLTANSATVDRGRDVVCTAEVLSFTAYNFKPFEEPDLYFVYSGGAANTNPQASLGGAASALLDGGIAVSKNTVLNTGGVSGVQVIGLIGGLDGVAQLDYVSSLGIIRWTGPSGQTAAAIPVTSGLFELQARDAYILLTIDFPSLPVADANGEYSVFTDKNTLFDDVGYTERGSNHTNYRCLFLRNNSANALSNVVMQVSRNPDYGTLTIGSEYTTTGLSQQPSAEYVEHSNLTYGGTQFLASHPVGFQVDTAEFYYGTEFLAPSYNSGVLVQNSDGSTTQLPTVIADEYDSTQLLDGLDFSSKLFWPTIAAGSFVSFWVKRYIAGQSSGSLQDSELYSLRIFYDEV